MCDGAWCFQQHSTLINSGSLGNVYFQDLHTFMVLFVSAGVSKREGLLSLAKGKTDPTGWLFKCIKAWDSTLVPLANVGLPVNNLICVLMFCIFFFFFFSNPVAVGYSGNGTYIRCHILLLSLECHDF